MKRQLSHFYICEQSRIHNITCSKHGKDDQRHYKFKLDDKWAEWWPDSKNQTLWTGGKQNRIKAVDFDEVVKWLKDNTKSNRGFMYQKRPGIRRRKNKDFGITYPDHDNPLYEGSAPPWE